MRELTILLELRHIVVHAVTLDNIRIPFIHQVGDQGDDLIHGLCCSRLIRRTKDPERIRILVVLGDVAVRDLFDRGTFFVRLVDHLIVNIRKILAESNIISSVLQITAQRIKCNERTGISQMEVVIDRRSAGVHLDLALFHRDKLFLCPGHRVKYLHFHSPLSKRLPPFPGVPYPDAGI